MEKVLNSYESLFIVDLSNGEEAAKATVAKFTDLIAKNGTLEASVPFGGNDGVRTLAYAIDDETTGAYVLMTYASAPEFPAELERIAKITDGVLRVLTIRK